jgi:transposase-like protein
MRKIISPEIKAKIALDALKGQLTWAQICSKYKVSQPQISQYKKMAEQKITSCFGTKTDKNLQILREKNDELLKLLGEAQLENAWLKKKFRGITD